MRRGPRVVASWWSRITGSRAGSATPSWRRSRIAASGICTTGTSRCARCRGPARPPRCSSASPEQRAQAENMLTSALRSVFAVAENYPQLQAVQEFKDLSENLTATEDKISFARRFYNGNVRDYNTSLQTFPTNVFAGMFGFKPEQYFELTDATERAVPQVKF